MPRPETKPPTEGGKASVINEIIAGNELIIRSHEKEIDKLLRQIDKLEKMNDILKE